MLPLVALLALAGLLAGCSLSLSLPGATTTASSTSTLTAPLTIQRGANNATLAIAPVYFGGKGPFHFIVDTGASVSLIRGDLARELALPPSGSRQRVSGVGGDEQITFVDVSHWHVGKIPLPNTSIGSGALPLTTGDSNLDGLLGSDIWSQFGRVTVDYNAATLTVYRSVPQSFAPSLTPL